MFTGRCCAKGLILTVVDSGKDSQRGEKLHKVLKDEEEFGRLTRILKGGA